MKNARAYEAAKALTWAFIWANSEQGQNYWNDVYKNLMKEAGNTKSAFDDVTYWPVPGEIFEDNPELASEYDEAA